MSLIERKWRYSAEDAAGAVVSGVIAAPDLRAAEVLLKSRRLVPLTLRADQRSLFETFGLSSSGNRMTISDLADVSARLRDLLAAGIPIAHALRLASEQARNDRERAFLNGLLADVRAGRSITSALSRSAYETPRLFRALVESGEALGALDKQMERLAAHYEEALKLRREIVAQLAYPTALIALIIATMMFLSFFVLPQFESIFATSDATPPAETRFVLALGAGVRRYWAYAPFLLLLLAIGGSTLSRRHAALFEHALLRAPIVGKYLRYADYGAFLRTLATLLGGGAPIARAMPLARQGMSLKALQEEARSAEDDVRVGVQLTAAMKKRTTCCAELISFIEIGEETGNLAHLAAQAASRAEAYVSSAIRRFMALLAPALTALMGLLTAGVIAAVMTGVLSLNETIY